VTWRGGGVVSKAADQGDVGAQGMMGTLYSTGQGVEQNYAEAYYWLDLCGGGERPKQAQYAITGR